MKTYSITQHGKAADVYIFGDITNYDWGGPGRSAYGLIKEIQELDADEINVHIDSYGGSVKEGWGMFSALREHKAKVNTYADGFVASAALYPFLAGDNRYASAVSAFFLHEISVSVNGYASDLREAADEAEKLTKIGIQAFVEVTGATEDEILELMKNETWLDPAEALEKGICTSIISTRETQKYTQSVRKQMIQALTAQNPQETHEEDPSAGREEHQNLFAKMFAAKGE